MKNKLSVFINTFKEKNAKVIFQIFIKKNKAVKTAYQNIGESVKQILGLFLQSVYYCFLFRKICLIFYLRFL